MTHEKGRTEWKYLGLEIGPGVKLSNQSLHLPLLPIWCCSVPHYYANGFNPRLPLGPLILGRSILHPAYIMVIASIKAPILLRRLLLRFWLQSGAAFGSRLSAWGEL